MNLSARSLFCVGLLAIYTQVACASQALTGQWITDLQGQSLTDPQTSGLTWWNGELLSLGDQSAAPELRMKIFRIAPDTGRFITEPIPITLSDEVRKSCFGDYLANSPDLEALTWNRQDANTLITVTEDASRAQLSPQCARKFSQTNSTSYPTLLLKISIDNALSRAEITAVRPVQFPDDANVGNLPNDGIEGLAIDDHQNLYLGLEKNMAGLPAIFKTRLTADFWTRDNFVKVIDANLTLPDLDDRGHPINDLDFMPSPIPGHPGYLIAAARNDDELWVFDLTNRVRPFVQPLQFFVGTDHSGLCPVYERVVQTALEGVAVHGQTLYLANDPWKQHYPDNIQCEVNMPHFLKMAPLLFQMPVDPRWYTLSRSQPAAALPGISGMAQIESDRYLTVQDKKISNPGERLAVLQVYADKAPRYQPIVVSNWPEDQMANDLESVCALPGRPNEFLIAESGSWQGEFGRLFHIHLQQSSYARVLASYPLPLLADNNTTQQGDQFEGLVCAQKAANRYLLVLGERGGEQRRGSLVHGDFDIAAGQIQWSPQRLAVLPPQPDHNEPFQRDIADLYLESNVLWASAVREAGPAGPFSSFVYQVALIDPLAAEPVRLLRESRVFWQLDGLKIEGLAAPSPLLPGSSLSVGSEDEKLGGVWRSLFAPVGQRPQIPVAPATEPAATPTIEPKAVKAAGATH